MPSQAINGKAFEFSIADIYFHHLKENGVEVMIQTDSAYDNAKRCFVKLSENEQERFRAASVATFETTMRQHCSNALLNLMSGY